MNIVICGAGEVGLHSAESLTAAGHSVTVIDRDLVALRAVSDAIDVATLRASATDAENLIEAGTDDADVLIAATDSDESNLLTASIAKALGAKRTIARVHHSSYFEGHGPPQRPDHGLGRPLVHR